MLTFKCFFVLYCMPVYMVYIYYMPVVFYFSHQGHALVTLYVQFMLWLVKTWQVSSCGKFMQHLETFLLWQLKLTEFCVNLWCFFFFSTECTKWNSSTIKGLLLFMTSLFIGFLVEKYVACQSLKSDFGWHHFPFFTLFDA